jgi:NADH-quinone oxidoreductase subunit A
MGTVAILVFILAGIALVLIANNLSNLISHKSDNPTKREPYESGIKTIGPTWVRFKMGYYLFALVFLIFDVEIIFLVPWSVVFKKMGGVALIDIIIFLAILGLGLIYALKKRALKWN